MSLLDASAPNSLLNAGPLVNPADICDPLSKNPAHPALYESRDMTGNLYIKGCWKTRNAQERNGTELEVIDAQYGRGCRIHVGKSVLIC